MRTRLFCIMVALVSTLSMFGSAVGDRISDRNDTEKKTLYIITKLATFTEPGEVSVYKCSLNGIVTIPQQIEDITGTRYTVIGLETTSFKENVVVTSITIPEGITRIESGAFKRCKALQTISLPKSLTKADTESFEGCISLKEIKIADGNPKFKSIDGIVYSQDEKTIYVYPAGKTDSEYTIISSVETIGYKAFNECVNLTKLITANVKTINNQALYKCGKLETIEVSASVTNIMDGFAYKCTNLKAINVNTNNEKYQSNDGVLYDKGIKTLIYYPIGKTDETFSIPNTVEKINDFACRNALFKNIIIPENVKEVGAEAFYECEKLELIDIKEGSCSGKIGNAAFGNNHRITNVTIPASANNLGTNIFKNCHKLQKITVSENNTNYKDIEGVVYTKRNPKKLYSYPPEKNNNGTYTIDAGTEEIMESAFVYATPDKIIIPNTVKAFKDGAFYYAWASELIFEEPTSLEEIGKESLTELQKMESLTIPASVKKISERAIRYNKLLKTITIEENSNLESMGTKAFADNTALEEVIIGANCNLEKLGNAAFENCHKLKKVTIGRGSLKEFGEFAFHNCTALSEVIFEEVATLTTIGTRAFDGCSPGLTSITLPKSITTIGASAFTECEKLETVIFDEPSNIKTIGSNAFQNSGITGITLPDGLERIEREAFNNCHNLTTIHIPGTTTYVSPISFIFCSKLTDIQVDEENTVYTSVDGMLTTKEKDKLCAFPPGKANARYTRLPSLITAAVDQAFYSCYELDNITIPRGITNIGHQTFSNCKNLKSISFIGDQVPTFTEDAFLNTNTKEIILYVRKSWFENPDNQARINELLGKFQEVHPSFIAQDPDYDRGVEYFPLSIRSAGVIAFEPQRTSVIIPEIVEETYENKKYSYSTAAIMDFAFENNTKTETVVVLADVEQIGLDAFNGKNGNNIKYIYFTDTTVPTLASNDFDIPEYYPFNENQTVYVKESKVNEYKEVWGGTIVNNIEYKIPNTTSKNRATKCYPFGVDYHIADDVVPYLPLIYKYDKAGNAIIVRSRSIDDGKVPAGVGVLLRSKNTESTSSYCQMNEDNTFSEIQNITEYIPENYTMFGTQEDYTVKPNEEIYVLSSKYGDFRKISTGKTIPYFKAYLRVPSRYAGAKFVFMDEEEDNNTPTAIINIENQDEPAAIYYNLNGIKTNQPAKGIYIKNGKKTIIK